MGRRRLAREPYALSGEVRLIRVTRIRGQVDERGALASGRQGSEALEAQDAAERLRSIAERGGAPAQELPLAHADPVGEGGDARV